MADLSPQPAEVIPDLEVGEVVEAAPDPESTGSPHPPAVISAQARGAVRTFASFLGLCGFVAACVAGLVAGLPGVQVLLRAILALILCKFIGIFIGSAMRVLVEEHLARHRVLHPKPVPPPELSKMPTTQKSAA